ncbi:hypothetical protein ACH5RR_002118 [Cinchona calisaya]|uniref:Uncharacterized protein n=1 Tax=Cinchona calisaya TaxID=153742 RepID=A0ABD3B6P2_9GENT
MWQARQKQIELDDRLRGKIREGSSGRSYRTIRESGRSGKRQFDIEEDASPSCSLRKRDDEGLRDDEVEEFLRSRMKRGRGAVGSRMDETGPYLLSCEDAGERQLVLPEVEQREGSEKRLVLGPEKPSSLWFSESSEESSLLEEQKNTKKAGSSKQCSRKHRSKDKSRDKEKKKSREEKRR